MKRILFVVNRLDEGGIEQVLLDYILLLKENYDITVLSIYQSNSYYKKKIKENSCYLTLDIFRNKINFWPFNAIYSRIFDKTKIQQWMFNYMLKQKSFDTIIAFADGLSIRLVASNKKNIKKLAWVHTDFLEDNKNYDSISKLYNCFDKVIFVSQKLKEKFESKLNLNKTDLIYNPLNPNRFKPKESNELDSKKNNFIAIGRLSWEKGMDRIINSFNKLPKDVLNKCHLTIIGDGPDKNNIKKLIHQYKLDSSITLTGFISEPFTRFNNAIALLLPSRFEGFGLVLIEALYNGIPVIATNTTGANEILCNGKYGMLLKNDDNAFDNVLHEVCKHPEIMDSYKPFMKEALIRFDINKIKMQLEHVL